MYKSRVESAISNVLVDNFLNIDGTKGPNSDTTLGVRTKMSELVKDLQPADTSGVKLTDVSDTELAECVVVRQNTEGSKENGDSVDKKRKLSDDDEHLMRSLEKQLCETVGPDSEIDYPTFKKALKVKDSYFGHQFFKLIDSNKSDTIEVSELIPALRRLTNGTSTEKLKFLFDIYDGNGDGTVDIEELRMALRACMVESSVTLGEEELDQLTQALFDEADEDNSGTISFDELQAIIERYPGVKENLCMGTAQWLKPASTRRKKEKHRYLTKAYFVNNLRKIIFFALFILVNIGLFVLGCWMYRDSNWFIVFARGCGQCLNFTPAFVVVLMLRKCITWLRATRLGVFLPLDQHILFHKVTGFAILFFALVHTFMHIGNAVTVAESDFNITIPVFLFTTQANIGWVAGLAPLSGWLLTIILVAMVICSLPFIRRSGCFEVFYWTHYLYIPFWILLILHARYFWCWFVVPGVMFLLEKIFRSKLIKRVRYGDSFIEEVNLLPSEVTHLVISKPPNMRFHPGDYLFLQIPAIAKYEWHPFTISSAPELEDKLWLHVRSAGHWTKKLYKYFNTYTETKHTVPTGNVNKGFNEYPHEPKSTTTSSIRMNSIRLITDFSIKRKHAAKASFKSRSSVYKRKSDSHKKVHVPCYIDGPYGTPSREIFESEHAVLIGSGIGVTPYASILQSIMYRFKAFKRCCPNCAHSWYDNIPPQIMTLRKVDFIWINRDQKSFEWFVSLLAQLELEQSLDGGLGNFLEMHMYMTSALNKTDMKGIGLQMALDLIHKNQKKDLLTGLHTRTQPGRPNFSQLFKKIAAEKKGHVKIFFCGNPMLAKTVKQHCEKFGFSFSKENF